MSSRWKNRLKRWRRSRWKTAAAVGLISIFLLLVWPAERPPRAPDDLCAIFSEKRHWYASARSSFERWGVSEAVQLAVIYQESGFRARAQPPREKVLWIVPGRRPSSAYGYTQALGSTWRDFRSSTGRARARRDDFDDAAHFVGWYGAEIRRLTEIPEDDVASLYLAYHEGPGGFGRGTHLAKPWLLDAARRVGERADVYRGQYDLCQEKLRHRNWGKLWLLMLALAGVATWLNSRWRSRRNRARRRKR